MPADLYLDSAELRDVAEAIGLGVVRGVTTNPTLLKVAGARDPLSHFEELAARCPADFILYYQPTGVLNDLFLECNEVRARVAQQVVFKIPATSQSFGTARRLVDVGLSVSLTAAQSVGSYLAASSMRCHSVIPYYDRALRDPGTVDDLVGLMRHAIRSGPLIIAASLKSEEQVIDAFSAGADAATVPLAVLRRLVDCAASNAAEKAFSACYGSQSVAV